MNKIKYIDKVIKQNSTEYNGYNFTEILITFLYLQKNISFQVRIRKMFKLFIFFILGVIKRLTLEIKTNNIEKIKSKEDSKIKFVFVQMFHVDDERHFRIIDKIICEYSNYFSKNEIAIITPNTDVKEYYKEYFVLEMQLPKFINIRKNKNGLNLKENLLINSSILLYDKALLILREMNPQIVFTTQDFHMYDQIFVKAAKKLNILTITHQHGMIPYPNPGLFKYVFSDYIMLWGKGSYQTLKTTVPKEKLIITGTDKFNYLIDKEQEHKRSNITIAMNPIPKKQNTRIIDGMIRIIHDNRHQINSIDEIIIKLHPSLNKKQWEIIVNKIFKTNNIKLKCTVTKGNNYEVLYKTKILIAYKSTISLEAMIAGCSVIELNYENIENYNENRLFLEMKESVLTFECIGDEIIRRLTDKEYSDIILEKQKKIVKNAIEDFSICKEIEFINKLMKKQANMEGNYVK